MQENIVGAIVARPKHADASNTNALPGSHEVGQVPKYLQARKMELAELHEAKLVSLLRMAELQGFKRCIKQAPDLLPELAVTCSSCVHDTCLALSMPGAKRACSSRCTTQLIGQAE